MAETSEHGLKSSVKLISLQDVLFSFNNSIGEEQAWAVCYQCAQYFLSNQSQDKFRDIVYYGTTAIKLSSEGDLIIDGSLNQGSGKGPPKSRSSLSLSQEFKSLLTPQDVVQALGTAIYKALDFGLPEEEEPHLSGELEELIEALTDQPTDDDEGIDIERDSDDSPGGKEQSIFQDIMDIYRPLKARGSYQQLKFKRCAGHLTGKQNAAVHYKAVCRALATEAKELLTFLDIIASGQAKLDKKKLENADDGLDDLERADWARLWVQIMGQLRHGVRLKKVESVHLPRVEFELTPFEILLEDIRTRRYNLNRIMVNGDIPPNVKSDAHAVILDFIRSRPPLKSAKNRQLKRAPVREMEPREKLLEEIRKPQNLKPVRKGKLLVGARKSLLENDDMEDVSSDEDKSQGSRKVIKPIAAFQVSTDDSDSYFSESDEDDQSRRGTPDRHTGKPDAWKHAATRDVLTQPSTCRNLTRRHTIGTYDTKKNSKVQKQTQHAPVIEEDEEEMPHGDSFVRSHAARRPTKMVSYRQQHVDDMHDSNTDSVSGDSTPTDLRPRSPMKHGGHCAMSRSHNNLVDNAWVNPQISHMHDNYSRELSSCRRSLSLASVVQPQRSVSPSRHVVRSVSPNCLHAGRPESPVRHLTRSETFTYSTPHRSRQCAHNQVYVSARSDSPHSRHFLRADSFPPPRSESPQHSQRAESPRRHSVHTVHVPKDVNVSRSVSVKSRRHSAQHVAGSVSAHDNRARTSSPVHNMHAIKRTSSIACERQLKHDRCDRKVSRPEHSTHHHGNRSRSQSPIGHESHSHMEQKTSLRSNLQEQRESSNRQGNQESDNSDYRQGQRPRPSIIRARSKPESRSNRLNLKEEEDKHFEFIEKRKPKETSESNKPEKGTSDTRSFSEENKRVSRVPRSVIARSQPDRTSPLSDKSTSSDGTSDEIKHEPRSRSGSRLTRQPVVRAARTDVRSKIQSKSVTFDSDTNNKEQQRLDRTDRSRRVGVVSHENISEKEQENIQLEKDNTDSKQIGSSLRRPSQRLSNVSPRDSTNEIRESKSNEVQSNNDTESRQTSPGRHEFKRVKPLIRSRSEVRQRSEIKPVKVSHDLQIDLETRKETLRSDVVVPAVSEPDVITSESIDLLDHDVPDVIKTSRAEFKVKDLLHVSLMCESPGVDTNPANFCSDSSTLPHKWQNPIECLSLTLEEITHIRMVLTKAELESLITDRELYALISKGKVCFTCKKVKFSLFGQWGTKCKFCQRNICNYCLRKMSVPTEHFEKIPVYTLSPVPISPEILDALKVYESTGSVPQSPQNTRKKVQITPEKETPKQSPEVSPKEESAGSPTDEARLAAKRRTLQRSHTIGVGSRPPPNKALLKGPQMSICCECKSMIMEIIRASRSSVSVVPNSDKIESGDRRAITPTNVPTDNVQLRTRLDLNDRPRPKSMLDNFSLKSFSFLNMKTDTDA